MSQRAKRILWPSIPNPEKSKMMQKMEMTNELVRFHCYWEKLLRFRGPRVFLLSPGAAAGHQHPEGGGMGHRQPADRTERTSHHLCRDAITPGELRGRVWRRPWDSPQCRSPRRRIHHHGDVPAGRVNEHASQPREGAGCDGVEGAAGLCETVQHRLHLGQSGTSVITDRHKLSSAVCAAEDTKGV